MFVAIVINKIFKGYKLSDPKYIDMTVNWSNINDCNKQKNLFINNVKKKKLPFKITNNNFKEIS